MLCRFFQFLFGWIPTGPLIPRVILVVDQDGIVQVLSDKSVEVLVYNTTTRTTLCLSPIHKTDQNQIDSVLSDITWEFVPGFGLAPEET